MERLVVIPTTEYMTNLTAQLSRDIDEKLEENSTELRSTIGKIIIVPGYLPGDMGREIQKQLKLMFKDMFSRLHNWDNIFLKDLDDQKQAVIALQQQNEQSVKNSSWQSFWTQLFSLWF